MKIFKEKKFMIIAAVAGVIFLCMFFCILISVLNRSSKPTCEFKASNGQKADEYNRFVASLDVREEVDLRFEVGNTKFDVDGHLIKPDNFCPETMEDREIKIGEEDYMIKYTKFGEYEYELSLQKDRDSVVYYLN